MDSDPSSIIARTLLETAAKVGCGKSYLYQQIRNGTLRARKAGKRTLILDADLRDWLANLPVIEPKELPATEVEEVDQ